MINVYENLKNDEGNAIPGRTMLFIRDADVDGQGDVKTFISGLGISPSASGTLFIVDEHLIEQIDKIKMVDGGLIVKEGETIEEPQKTELELQEEKLMQQLAEIRKKQEQS